MIVYAECTCILYHVSSLKEKRSIIKPLLEKARRTFNVSMAEVGYHDYYEQTEIEVAVVTSAFVHAEQVIQNVIKMIDQENRIELTHSVVERI